MNLNRMWINQPSTLQPHHELHGRLVLVASKELAAAQRGPHGTTVRVWFADVWNAGRDIVSQQVLWHALSDGWPEHLRGRGASERNISPDLSTSPLTCACVE